METPIARLRECTGSPEPALFADTLSHRFVQCRSYYYDKNVRRTSVGVLGIDDFAECKVFIVSCLIEQKDFQGQGQLFGEHNVYI